jgi:hypothetical protein
MKERKKSKNGVEGKRCECGCGCGSYEGGWGWHGKHSVLRIVIGLLIIVFAFWFGMKIGKFRAMLSFYAANYYGNGMYYGSAPMMRGGPGAL